ncbi:MAG TPA: alpha-glucan family phosphorylase [Vicinamibacterales bacterium]
MSDKRIAYFSMEIGVEPTMPTYAGGLGILAGDTIRGAADLALPMVAVTLVHRKGYFFQRLDRQGHQTEEPAEWVIGDFLTELPERVAVPIEGCEIQLRCWLREVVGRNGFKVPVYFLDADLPENPAWQRTLTDSLYGGDSKYRLCQEAILGIGGIRMLRALGHTRLERFHMNEGHSSLVTLELLQERLRASGRTTIADEDVQAVRRMCVFTTHTPVAAGHDRFPMDLATQVLGDYPLAALKHLCCYDGAMNLTYLALRTSYFVNGVSMEHGEVSRHLFAEHQIDAITNGVHAATWVCPEFEALFDRRIPSWRRDSFSLRYVLSAPSHEIWMAHVGAKRRLIEYVNREVNAGLDVDALTLGFARRATAYKRPDLLFHDRGRLRALAANGAGLQVIFAGKAHPGDQEGKALIERVFAVQHEVAPVRVAYLENYDMTLARLITAGVDVWLNTPEPPFEASGTSGMKAALNGVPSLSVLDGWWLEGHIEGVTGWAIGDHLRGAGPRDRSIDATSIYDKLEQTIMPTFYRDQARFVDIMRHTIALNGSFFTAERMLYEYMLKAWGLTLSTLQ